MSKHTLDGYETIEWDLAHFSKRENISANDNVQCIVFYMAPSVTIRSWPFSFKIIFMSRSEHPLPGQISYFLLIKCICWVRRRNNTSALAPTFSFVDWFSFSFLLIDHQSISIHLILLYMMRKLSSIWQLWAWKKIWRIIHNNHIYFSISFRLTINTHGY